MRVLPVTMTTYGGNTRTLNSRKMNDNTTSTIESANPSFKGGKSIMGGFIAGVVGTVAISTLAPFAILGAGAIAIGGALAGDAVSKAKAKNS